MAKCSVALQVESTIAQTWAGARIGCGIGRNLNNLDGYGVGVDHNQHSVDEANKRGFEAYGVEEFKEKFDPTSEQFDSLLIAHVIEHTGMDIGERLIREYLPYLKVGGKVVLITPQEKGYATDSTHVEFIDFDKLSQLLLKTGLCEKKHYSFPFPRIIGKIFPYNEFVSIAVKSPKFD